jgi:hypothetical protein
MTIDMAQLLGSDVITSDRRPGVHRTSTGFPACLPWSPAADREVRFPPDFQVGTGDAEGMTVITGTTATSQTATQAGTAAATAAAYEIRAITPDVLGELRQRDDSGAAPWLLVDEEGGSPLRCCLRPISPGERVALVSYAPLRRWARETGADPGPYEETGPVFIHAGPCAGPPSPGYPEPLAGSHRVFRSYSADGRILGGRLFGVGQASDASSAEAVLAGIFADAAVALVHIRAVEFGCFIFEARRP